MSLSNITLSLFDIFGYLLPGFVVFCAASISVSSFTGSSALSLTGSPNSILLASVAAYFLGHLCHLLAEWLYQRLGKYFKGSEVRLSEGLYRRVRAVAEETYGVQVTSDDKGAHRRELYLMADAYLAASGNVQERDSLLAREGFAKTSTAAFAILTLVLAASLFKGGATVNLMQTSPYRLDVGVTIGLSIVTLFATWLFWLRFLFFRRLKTNNIQVLFLACVQRERSNL
jgi:hypothetical protein